MAHSFNWSQQQIEQDVVDLRTTETKKESSLRCPRCDSNNTKFCYYNNYSRTQPRHFCRACRRHWTHGGTLRTVPVGGCPRKNKRQKLETSAGSSGALVQQPAQLYSSGQDSNLFPDIFRQMMYNFSAADQPAEQYVGMGKPVSASKDEGGVINPSPIAAASSSGKESVAGDATLLSLMPGSESWIPDPSPLPESYYWWNDTLSDLFVPQPAATQAPGYPWTDANL